MTCITNKDTVSVVYRSVEKHEQQETLDLLYSVFGADHPGCFERDFTAEGAPMYQEGDTLGAWYDGQLVSVVHIRRVILHSRDIDDKYLCGGISDVATLEKYQNRGFSRHLLRLAIDRMEQSSEFHLSMLGTGRHKHYSIFGWEQISVPAKISIEWNNFDSIMSNIEWRSTSDILSSDKELLLALYTRNPREYQFDRSPPTLFEHLVGWNWQLHQAIMYVCHEEEEAGYVVIGKPNNASDIYVSEWRASNVHAEKKLLKIAAEEIQRRQGKQNNIVRLHGLPQFMSIDELEQWAGTTKIDKNDDNMIRNIRLPKETIEKIKMAYSKGSATFWPGDCF